MESYTFSALPNELILDIESFLEQLSELKNASSHTELYARAKGSELHKRLGRYRVEAKNASNGLQTPNRGISVSGKTCLFGDVKCNCGINGYSGQDF